MKIVTLSELEGPDAVTVVERPAPALGPEDVRITVRAASVNHIDLSLIAGRLTQAGLLAPAEEYYVGWDVAGTVAAVGGNVRTVAVGDAVVGLRAVLGQYGSHAEEVVLHQSAVARAPRGVSLQEAATLPMAGLTAWGAFRASQVGPGSSLLVTGANGGVGRAVVEIAALYGVRVVALADDADTDDLLAAGAAHVVPRGVDVAAAVRTLVPLGVDGVIDGAVLGAAAHEALRDGGRFVALVRPFAPSPLRGTSVVVHEVQASGGDLAFLSALAESGRLSLRVAATFPLDLAAEAYRAAQASGLRGRVVLLP